MATLKDRATEAILALEQDAKYARRGGGCVLTWRTVEEWLKRHYGKDHGVTDGTFYNARRDLKPVAANEVVSKKPVAPVQVSEKVEMTQTVATEDFTLAELVVMNEFCKKHGGRARVIRMIEALGLLVD